ncbi:hypothetical protein [Dactylosporangium matsuzakiense]|nr:hypothetical protein [Dactylosporangium matsuzakiense]
MSHHHDRPAFGQQITTRWGVTFTPFHDPAGRVGFRAARDGVTDLVYLDAPVDRGAGRPLTVTAVTRPDTATGGDADVHTVTATASLTLTGLVGADPWTDGYSVGWHIRGRRGSRYAYLLPSRSGADEDLTDVYVYVTGSGTLDDADVVARLLVQERTTERATTPVTGPAVTFDPAAFTVWFTAPWTRLALPEFVTARYDSGDPLDSAASRVLALLDAPLPPHVWRVDPAVSAIRWWPTADPAGAAAGDGGGVLTFGYRGLELSAGQLPAAALIRELRQPATHTVRATAHDAAVQALTAAAARINAAVAACTAILGVGTTPAPGRWRA